MAITATFTKPPLPAETGAVVLSFDDGLENTFYYGYPLMQARGLKRMLQHRDR